MGIVWKILWFAVDFELDMELALHQLRLLFRSARQARAVLE
jgi:hypothetical protein